MFEKLKMKGRTIVGYAIIIAIMLVTSFLALIQLRKTNESMNEFVEGALKVDKAVKMCKINVNIAARKIGEMILETDSTTYFQEEREIISKIAELAIYLEELKMSGIIEQDLYNRYEIALIEWGEIGVRAINELKAGNKEQATNVIVKECKLALNEIDFIVTEIDTITEAAQTKILEDNRRAVSRVSVIIILFIFITIMVAFILVAKLKSKNSYCCNEKNVLP